MTIAEVIRAVEAKKEAKRLEAQEKATFDYILADLIGRSVSRIYSSSAKMPAMHEIYTALFDGEKVEEEKQAKLDELSVTRFKAFAQSYNSNFKGGVNK